jgi:hypothetical protein
MKLEDVEQQQYDDVQPDERASLPLGQSLSCGVGTFLLAGAVDMVAHFGLTGLVVGGIAAYAASQHGPELLEHLKGAWPAARPAPPPAKVPRTLASHGKSQRSLLDRTLGWFPDEEPDEDTVLVDATPAEQEPAETWERWPPAARPARERLIDLSPDVQIDKRDLSGKALLVCGMRRHGKTTLGARIAEQLGKHNLPLVIPDLEGDYLSLAEVLPRAVIAGHSHAARQYPASQFIALDSVQAAYQLGYDTLEYGYQVMLDLSSYTDLDAAIAIQINVIRGLFHWTSRHPEKRVPCHVFLDEAQRYLPQTLSDSVIQNRTVLGGLLKCYMDIIGIGGKRGIVPVILTQRFAQVNNKIMAQSEVFFLLRQTHDTDLDRCMEYVNHDVATRKQIACFQPGQGVYIAFDGSQVVTQFHQRESSGERSATPQAEAASRYAHMPMYRPAVREMAREAVPSADQSNERVMVPPPQAEPHGEVKPTAVEAVPFARPETDLIEVSGVRLTRKQKLAYDLHLAGNTTITALATAMSQNGAYGTVDNNVAYRLRNELAACGLIRLPHRNKG